MSVGPESEFQNEQNIAVAKKLQAILIHHKEVDKPPAKLNIDATEMAGVSITPEVLEEIKYLEQVHAESEGEVLTLALKDDPFALVGIDVYYTPNFGPDIELPKEFRFPLYTLKSWQSSSDVLDEVTSPYGVVKDTIIGEDDNIYSLENIIYVTRQGYGGKLERIFKIERSRSLEAELANIGIDLSIAELRVGFIPKEEDTRFIPLNAEDYRRIYSTLVAEDEDRFIIARPNKA